ncbi:MAG: hypothetical protein KQI35_10295 [Bacteroidetes bacterium]|nr:hypothetical protein [Bacteroidota bacterium]
MKKLIFLTSVILMAFMDISCSNSNDLNQVMISGRQLMVNDEPYLIKGICYKPVPRGSDKADFSTISGDLELMVEAGINTIRVYSPINEKAVLDEIHQAGLKIIIGFGYNQSGYYDILSGSFIDYVNTYKTHPAILLWELGNEYNYHPEWFEGNIENWYKAMNSAAVMIHENDPAHPVTTAHGELPDSLALAMCPQVDIWGMNVYRWDNPGSLFDEWKAVSEKPMYLSEAGADSYMTISVDGYEQGNNEQVQADANRNILNAILDRTDICSGVTLFAFSDEWWKAGNNDTQEPGGWAPKSSGVPYDGTANEEYWGIVDIDRNKKMTFEVVREIYHQVH